MCGYNKYVSAWFLSLIVVYKAESDFYQELFLGIIAEYFMNLFMSCYNCLLQQIRGCRHWKLIGMK